MKAKKLLMQLAASCWLFVATAAHALPPQDERQLVSVLDSYSKQALQEDFSQLGEVMPPALIEAIGRHLQLPRERVIKLLTGGSTMMTSVMDIKSYEYDMKRAEEHTSPTGRPYLFIPTLLTMELQQKTHQIKGRIVALKDNGRWYLMNIQSKQHLALLAEAYPDLADIQLPDSEEPLE